MLKSDKFYKHSKYNKLEKKIINTMVNIDTFNRKDYSYENNDYT